jgi:hypothetical protein
MLLKKNVSVYTVGLWTLVLVAFQFIGQKTGSWLESLPHERNREDLHAEYADIPLQLPKLRIDPAWQPRRGRPLPRPAPTLDSIAAEIDTAFVAGRAEDLSRVVQFVKDLSSEELRVWTLRLLTRKAPQTDSFAESSGENPENESWRHLVAIRWMATEPDALSLIGVQKESEVLRGRLLEYWIPSAPEQALAMGLEHDLEELKELKALAFPGEDHDQQLPLLVRDDPSAVPFDQWGENLQVFMTMANAQRSRAIDRLVERVRKALKRVAPDTENMSLPELWGETDRNPKVDPYYARELARSIITSWLYAEPDIADEELEKIAPRHYLIQILGNFAPQRARRLFENLPESEQARIPEDNRPWNSSDGALNIETIVATRPLSEALEFEVERSKRLGTDPNLATIAGALIENDLFELAAEIRLLVQGDREPVVFSNLFGAWFKRDPAAALAWSRQNGNRATRNADNLLRAQMGRDPIATLNESVQHLKTTTDVMKLQREMEHLAKSDPVLLAQWLNDSPALSDSARVIALHSLCSKRRNHPAEWKFSWAASVKAPVSRLQLMQNALYEMTEKRTPNLNAIVEAAPIPDSEKAVHRLRSGVLYLAPEPAAP